MCFSSIAALVLSLIGVGCSLQATATIPSSEGGAEGMDAGPTDASVDARPVDEDDGGGVVEDSGSGWDAEVSDTGAPDGGTPFCDETDLALQVCLRFEDNLDDESSTPHALSSSNEMFGSGRVGRALLSDSEVSVRIEQAGELADVPLTVEGWVRPRSIPDAGERYGLVDLDGQWSAFLYENGDIACRRGGDAIARSAAAVDAFTHFACVFVEGENRIYIDGALRDTASSGAEAGTSTDDVRVAGNAPDGDELAGALDELRIFTSVRSDADIAAASAR